MRQAGESKRRPSMFYDSLTIPAKELSYEPTGIWEHHQRGKGARGERLLADLHCATYGSGLISGRQKELGFTKAALMPKGRKSSSFMYISGLMRRERRLK